MNDLISQWMRWYWYCNIWLTISHRSHDGFTEESDGVLSPKPGSKYASQQIVFDDLGKGVLNNAFNGKYGVTVSLRYVWCDRKLALLVWLGNGLTLILFN